MRFCFPNLSPPKKAAKHLANQLSVPLSSAQRAVSRGCGYRDWHDLEGQATTGPACILDHHLTSDQFIEQQHRVILAIARDLSITDGDVQYALGLARLTGDRPPQLYEQIAIRLACWRATTLPNVAARQRGAVGTLKSAGWTGEAVILREYGRPTSTVSDRGITTVGDFEYVSPRVAPPLFLPMRLYLPYGYWSEADGARVLFSRDYKPLWRLRAGKPNERVDPWLRISYVDETHLWSGTQHPWSSKELKAWLDQYLIQNGICTLPILSDALPLLVHDGSTRDLKMAHGAEFLRAQRATSSKAK